MSLKPADRDISPPNALPHAIHHLLHPKRMGLRRLPDPHGRRLPILSRETGRVPDRDAEASRRARTVDAARGRHVLLVRQVGLSWLSLLARASGAEGSEVFGLSGPA
jgi:hypothetical protein